MANAPNILDLDCTKYSFQPGDKILVRVFGAVDSARRKQIRAMIEKWAGVPLDILVIDATQLEMLVQRSPPQPAIAPEGALQ